MKELTTYNKIFTESEEKKENNFLRSRNFGFTRTHFNISECLKWLEKPLWLINITDMFHKYRIKSLNGVLDSFVISTRKRLCRSLLLKE